MKNLIVFAFAIVALASCNSTSKISNLSADSLKIPTVAKSENKALSATLKIKDIINVGEPVELKFTVHNHADTAQQFCKWHTPFEPLMSKYLEVKDENGVEVDYKGAMARRMMPPPASSYIKVNSKDSLTMVINLLKGYAITKPSKYTVKYIGQGMSGLIAADSVSFVYK